MARLRLSQIDHFFADNVCIVKRFLVRQEPFSFLSIGGFNLLRLVKNLAFQ